MNGKILLAVGVVLMSASVAWSEYQHHRRQPPEGAKLHKFSTTVERERPELNEETRALINAYRRDPSEANRKALEKQVLANYDKVIARKKAKLEELRKTAKEQSKVKEMEEIVREVVADKEHRIAQSMARFTDKRLKPGVREAKDGFHPVLGAKTTISIAHTEVTNAEFKRFRVSWPNDDDKPAVNISYQDALAYCAWLSKSDSCSSGRAGAPRTPQTKYRLPSADEWECAAGHMPKDADFNAKGEDGAIVSVGKYAKTLSASGAIDMWGNVWEWTSSDLKNGKAVKGGAFDAGRTKCRTEERNESRDPTKGYANVGFRVVREDK